MMTPKILFFTAVLFASAVVGYPANEIDWGKGRPGVRVVTNAPSRAEFDALVSGYSQYASVAANASNANYASVSALASNALTAVTVTGPQSNTIASALQVEADTLQSVAARGGFAGTESIGPLRVSSVLYGPSSGNAASGSDYFAVGNQAGSGANGVGWSAFGSYAGGGCVGDSWSAYGRFCSYLAKNTNSVSVGRFAGYAARGNTRLYIDTYATDPAYSANGAINDRIFGESDGTLYLGRGAAAPGGAVGGTLRGPWSMTSPTVSTSIDLFGYMWAWNDEFHTFDVGLDGGVTGQLFQELHVYAKNNTGSTLAEGRAVCVVGATGDNVLVGYADSQSAACKWTTMGLITQAGGITNGGSGYICRFGNVNDVNTSMWQVSNTLWLASSGTLTNVEPAAGSVQVKVKIGTVLRSHATQGRIEVGIQVIPSWSDVGAVDANTVTNIVLDNQALNLTLYGYASITSSVAGAYRLTNAVPTGGLSVITNLATTNNAYVAKFVTAPGLRFTRILYGTLDVHVHHRKGASGVATLKPELYLLDSDGNKLYEYETAQYSDPLTTATGDSTIQIPIPSNLVINATMRLGIYLKANVTSGTPDIYIDTEDNNNFIVEVPVPSAEFVTQSQLNAYPTFLQTTNLFNSLDAVPYSPWTTNLWAELGTATVTYACGNQPSLVCTNATVITLDSTGYGTSGVSRVALSLYSGTNSVTFLTNAVDYSTTPTLVTNAWNTILFRRVSADRWKGAQLQ